MGKKFISDAVEKILSQSTEISVKNRQNWCNTAHVFWALMKFLQDKANIRTFILKCLKYGCGHSFTTVQRYLVVCVHQS